MMYRNSEGYAAPVEGYVIAKITREEKERENNRRKREILLRPLVYIVSPFAGNISYNIRMAKQYCRFAVEQKKNPVASHLFYTRFLEDKNPDERETGMMYGLALLARCSEVWVFGQYISKGMKEEIRFAERLGRPVRYFSERMEEKHEND